MPDRTDAYYANLGVRQCRFASHVGLCDGFALRNYNRTQVQSSRLGFQQRGISNDGSKMIDTISNSTARHITVIARPSYGVSNHDPLDTPHFFVIVSCDRDLT